MKRTNKHGDSELIRRIVQRESECQTADEKLLCSRCFSKIVQGRYYEIGGDTVCSECIDACERRK